MRKFLFVIFQFALFIWVHAQTSGLGPLLVPDAEQLENVDHFIDSLRPSLLQAKDDTAKINLLLVLANAYHNSKKKTDSSFSYNQQAMELSQKENYERGLFDSRTRKSHFFRDVGNYAKALQLTLTNLPIAEQYKDILRLSFTLMDLCGLYNDVNDFSRQLTYARQLQQLMISSYFKRQSDARYADFPYLINFALAFNGLNQTDSALYYLQRYYRISLSLKDNAGLTIATANLADVLLKLGRRKEAYSYYRLAINFAKLSDRPYWIANSYLGWAKIFHQESQVDFSAVLCQAFLERLSAFEVTSL